MKQFCLSPQKEIGECIEVILWDELFIVDVGMEIFEFAILLEFIPHAPWLAISL